MTKSAFDCRKSTYGKSVPAFNSFSGVKIFCFFSKPTRHAVLEPWASTSPEKPRQTRKEWLSCTFISSRKETSCFWFNISQNFMAARYLNSSGSHGFQNLLSYTIFCTFYQLSSISINYHQFLSTIINFYQLSSISINYHHFLSTAINYCPLSSTSTNYNYFRSTTYHHLLSTIIIFYQLTSTSINFYQLSIEQWIQQLNQLWLSSTAINSYQLVTKLMFVPAIVIFSLIFLITNSTASVANRTPRIRSNGEAAPP
jgi:hypothetical protein